MAGYKARQRYRLHSKTLVSAVLIISLVLFEGRANCVFAQPAELPLHLEVSLNGEPTNLIAAFTQMADGRIAATRAELTELRIDVPGAGPSEEMIYLDTLPQLAYRYDEENQAIHLDVAAQTLTHSTFNASELRGTYDADATTTGAVLNYGIYSALNEESLDTKGLVSGMTAHVDGRIFGNYGVLEASAILGFDDFDTVRLDTTWTRHYADKMLTFQAGDFVSGGLVWTRPLRMAGLKVKRNFALRPDLITKPLPSVAGSAAVPSTVDVYVNNIKTYSRAVPSGPFTISQLPVVSGRGVARVVVRDATGRETETETSFYSSPELLSEGMLDYSLEAGFARLNYGTEDSRYDETPAISASARYGYSDDLTVLGHAEAGDNVVNVGAGIVTPVRLLGALSLAASASWSNEGMGAQVYAAFQGEYMGVHLNARSQRSLGDYTDLAAQSTDGSLIGISNTTLLNIEPPKAIDYVSLGVPVSATGGQLSVGYLHNERQSGDVFDIVNLSYSQRVTNNISVYSTGFNDLSDNGNAGLYVGLSMSLGNRQSFSTGANSDQDGTNYTANYVRTADRKPGSVGWRLRASEGEQQRVTQGDIEYHGKHALLRASLANTEDETSASAYVEGGIAMTGDGVFLSRRLDGPFAIVDAGAPNIEVQHENRVVGTTNDDGKLLVPNMLPFQRNRITIDPEALPINALISETSINAVPEQNNGTSVRFAVDDTANVALVEFKKPDGSYVEPGYAGVVVETGEEFMVGYDGQAFITGLSTNNNVEIQLANNTCRAAFAFEPDPEMQVIINGVVCQ